MNEIQLKIKYFLLLYTAFKKQKIFFELTNRQFKENIIVCFKKILQHKIYIKFECMYSSDVFRIDSN